MTTAAVSLPLNGVDLRAGIEIAREARKWGYESCWVSEAEGADAVSQLGALAATCELDLGVVAPVDTRTAFVLGMTAVSLAQLSAGRFVLGIDGGAHEVGHVREIVAALRPVLRGERSTHDGRFVRLGGYRPHAPPPEPVPLYVGARDPESLVAAGEIADGVCLDGVPAEQLPDLLAHVRRGASEAGRDVTVGGEDEGRFRVVVRVFCAVGGDADDRSGTAAASERFGDRSVIGGDEEDVARSVGAYAEAGADVVAVHPIGDGREDLVRTLRAAAAGW